MEKRLQVQIFIWLNVLEVLGIALVLILAFAFQLILHELPCPLCLLQRAGFLITSTGLLLNVRYGIRPSHYVITLLGALLTSFVALRQIALHVVPGSVGYGSSVFGMHMYTWSFIVCMIIVVYTSIIMGFTVQYQQPKTQERNWKFYVLFSIMLALAAGNFVSVLAVCGVKECPDNPISYIW
jgi:disulfide bond formation protein DsbB